MPYLDIITRHSTVNIKKHQKIRVLPNLELIQIAFGNQLASQSTLYFVNSPHSLILLIFYI